MDQLSINLFGLLLIAFIVWWFWLYRSKPRQLQEDAPVEILVQDGVYTPSRIQVAAGQPVTLVFIRKDPAPCAEAVLFEGLNISKHLPLDTPVEVKITPEKAGEYAFSCQMKMYQGSLVVI